MALLRACSCAASVYRDSDFNGVAGRVNDILGTYKMGLNATGGPWGDGAGRTGFYGSGFKWNIPARTTLYLAGYVQRLSNADGPVYIRWYGSPSMANLICELRLDAQGGNGIQFYEYDTTEHQSLTAGLELDTWYFLEVKVVFSATVGSVTIRMNGTQVAEWTNLDTCGAYTSGPQSIAVITGNNCLVDWDDIAIYDALDHADDTGGGNSLSDFTGPWRMTAQVPTADTAQKDWTPNSGTTNYTQIDDSDMDGDSTYVESNTVTDRDEYTLADGPSYPIVAVQIVAAASNPDAGGANITFGLESNGVDGASSQSVAAGGTYLHYRHTQDVDPNTNVAWTEAGFNAALLVLENG